jgi:lipopolysaccharide transport system permease protein
MSKTAVGKVTSSGMESFSNTRTSPTPTVLIKAHNPLFCLDLAAIWEYRELVYFLVWRDLKVRYRQTILGACWAILQPLLTMVIFTAVFGKLAKVPSDGLPYQIFAFSALLPWNLFASSLDRGGTSVVGNGQLISKIYFPRLILPLSGVLSPLADFAVSFSILVGMMFWFGSSPSWRVLALPVFILLAIFTAFAVALWLSALNVRYRDVGYAIPFLIQVWLFASPVAYPASLIPEKWRLLYGLNPMAGVIEGFRWALLGKQGLDARVIAASSVVVLLLMIPGVIFFKQTERTFADVI